MTATTGKKMAWRILQYPSPVLKEPALDVDVESDPDLDRLVKQLRRVMRDAPGVGLAAPQVGVQKRVLVYELEEAAGVLVNPVVVSASDETVTEEEGCLSFPGVAVQIERAASVVCEGCDPEGSPVRIEADDLLARVLQHEIDHLNGRLIIDRASPDDRKAALKEYRELNG